MTNAVSASFSLFSAEVSRREKLTWEAEREIADRYRSGDRGAARPLLEGSLHAVIAIALEYRRCGPAIEDLVQEGNVGLLKALDRFDPARGVRFATYAAYWIRAEIREYVARSYHVVRLGTSKAERRALWLYRRTREDRPEALAAMSGLSARRAGEMLPLLADRDPGAATLERVMDGAGSAETALGDAEERYRLRATVETIVAELPARDQDIVRRRLLAEEPATLEQLGDVWGVSKERVRQIEDGIKSQLRPRLAAFAPPSGARRDRAAKIRGGKRST